MLVADICHEIFHIVKYKTNGKAVLLQCTDGHNFLTLNDFLSPCPSASLSPDIVETSEPAVVGVSQLEGSPMDTSSPASATQEDAAPNPTQTTQLSQELSGSRESGLTDRQTDAETGWVVGSVRYKILTEY